MTKVAVTKDKLDELALHVSGKTGVSMPMTIQEMQDAIDGLSLGGTITQDANGYLVLDSQGSEGSAPSGPSTNMSDPIRFFDYDGTLVASYSAVPSSLPSVPTHTGLTNGTWNYNIQQITTQFNAMGTCDVGANYETSSGATEIDIELQEGRLHPYLSLAVNGTVSIDWGDNTTPDSVTGTSLSSRKTDIHHEYSQAGSYTIKISKADGDGYSLHCTNTYALLNNNSSTASANRVYSNCVQNVRVGSDCTIGSSAFYYCYSLQSVSIPSTVTSIGTTAFNYCYSLQSVSIPSTVTSIGSNAFYYCHFLQSVSIPSTVTSISASAFYYCYSLQSVSIPSTVTSIGNSAFGNCYSLQSVSIPSGVTSIGSSAFYYCYSLQSVSIPSGVTSIGSNTFSNCYSLQSVSIPSTVTSIGSNAFSNCYSLQSVSIPSTVTSIGYSAFRNCYSLAKITLPTNLTTVNDGSSSSTTNGCFQACYSLVSLTIPAGCTSFVQNEFKDCYGMVEYHFKATTPPTLANVNCFSNIQSDCKIYVPSASLTSYQTAENWSTYADYMVGE